MRYFNHFIFTTLAILFIGCTTTNPLEKELRTLIEGHDCKVGLALYNFDTQEYTMLHAEDEYPMQSVYKFPIAVAALTEVAAGKIALSDTITIPKEELYLDMWSPISKQYPEGAQLTYGQLIEYMVSLSDNMATDIIIEKIGGTARVQHIIDSLGARNIEVRSTEKELHESWEVQFQNQTTPKSMVEFISLFYHEKLLTAPHTQYLNTVMEATTTGSITRYIPQDKATVAYKTGFSGANAQGEIAAQNVVGIIRIEGGATLAFAIFITDSTMGAEAGYELIAQIGELVFAAPSGK